MMNGEPVTRIFHRYDEAVARIKELEAHVTYLQTIGTQLVEENRRLKRNGPSGGR